MTENLISKAIQIVGIYKLGKACGISYQAIYRWETKGRLPRTEWTGETDYASRIEEATKGVITRDQLLNLKRNDQSAAMGLTKDALKNRIYERKGQRVSVDEAMLMQDFSGTKFFANEVARQSGGVFLEVIPAGIRERSELLTEFNRLTQELGELSKDYELSVRDGQIDGAEKVMLKRQAYRIHKQLEKILAISFAIYEIKEDDDEKK